MLRIGAGPQAGDPVGPPFYGGAGTLNLTGGEIMGDAVGTKINVGERDNTNNINYTGIVNQSGGKISLNTPSSAASFLTSAPVAHAFADQRLQPVPGGTISVIAGSGNNNGINVRNGTFNMTGGISSPMTFRPIWLIGTRHDDCQQQLARLATKMSPPRIFPAAS